MFLLVKQKIILLVCLFQKKKKKFWFKSDWTGELFIWALKSVKSSYIATTNISVCHPSCFPGSFRNLWGVGNDMALALRKNWSPSLSSPAADFAVPKLGIISAKLFSKCPSPLLEAARSTAARGCLLSSWDAANMDWALQRPDNPGTRGYAFSQMFTPPHSSHLPHSLNL